MTKKNKQILSVILDLLKCLDMWHACPVCKNKQQRKTPIKLDRQVAYSQNNVMGRFFFLADKAGQS